ILVYFLTAHWSKPVDFSDETMEAARARVERFRDVFRGASEPAVEGEWERFAAALEDHFNTPGALAVMHGWRAHDLLRRALTVNEARPKPEFSGGGGGGYGGNRGGGGGGGRREPRW